MKKVLACICVLSGLLLTSIQAEATGDFTGYVIEVIDGEVMSVLPTTPSSQPIKVFLIGVDSRADRQAYDYASRMLLGKKVLLKSDSHYPSNQSDTGYYYLYQLTNQGQPVKQSYNLYLVEQGWADVPAYFARAEQYESLKVAMILAKRQGKGRFVVDANRQDVININRAGIKQLTSHFGLTDEQAKKWRWRILGNPINSVNELRELDADYFTYQKLSEELPTLHLSTNLNTANRYELTSLLPDSSDQSAIIDYLLNKRLLMPFTSNESWKNYPLLSRYQKMLSTYVLMDNDDDYYRYLNPDIKVANVNTANVGELMQALGLTQFQAERLICARKKESFQSVDKLFLKKGPLVAHQKNKAILSDNLTVKTDINQAYAFELTSLLGQSGLTSQQKKKWVARLTQQQPNWTDNQLKRFVGQKIYRQIAPYISY